MLPRFLLPIAASVAWAVVGLTGMTYGITYNWPDFVHVDYGFPLTFATHTLSTIVGPVDRWGLDPGSLSADLAFWLFGTVAVFLIVELLSGWMRRKKVPN